MASLIAPFWRRYLVRRIAALAHMPAKIRKQVAELTLDDFAACPVWEFALDEESEPDQDETTVRPVPTSAALDPSESSYLVAARFKLADGTQMQGYLTPPAADDKGLGRIQPLIITDRGQVGFWHGRLPPEPHKAYELLGRDAASVFPIRFESVVPLVTGRIVGTIPGFLCLERDFETVHIVR
jgi:hypothetical protein